MAKSVPEQLTGCLSRYSLRHSWAYRHKAFLHLRPRIPGANLRAMPITRPPLELFASTALGLESIAAGEPKSLGARGKQEVGGVSFRGDLDRLYRVTHWLRTASRLLVRIGRFHA